MKSGKYLLELKDYIFNISIVEINVVGQYAARALIEDANITEREFSIILSPPANNEGVVYAVVINNDGWG